MEIRGKASSMEFYRTCTALTWKNGRGVTNELLILPAGQRFADETFMLRLSSARVASSGPFSVFANHNRYLALLSGEVRLKHEETKDEEKLLRPHELYAFDGAYHTHCELLSEEALDFNVFVRKGLQDHRCGLKWLKSKQALNIVLGECSFIVVAVIRGKLRVLGAENEDVLQELQAVVSRKDVEVASESEHEDEECACIITWIKE